MYARCVRTAPCALHFMRSCVVHVYYREIPAFSKIIINTLATTRALYAKCNVLHTYQIKNASTSRFNRESLRLGLVG